MIVVLKANPTQAMIDRIVKRVQELGLKAHVIVGAERTVVAAVGDDRKIDESDIASLDEVEKVLPILAPYKIASKEARHEATEVRAGSFRVGAGQIGVAAGPCSVEGEQQIMEAARMVKACGATALRGGAFKPRTSPYAFQGLKELGLQFLAAAREETGLAIVTEVMTPHHVEMVCKYADVLQIGARNMQNYHLLQAVGETRTPVLLKRGPSATIEEFLLAAEYILDQGNSQVILCERGIRTFETHTRFTLPLATVPYLREKTHLPIVVDPSHGTGIASLVPSMSAASIAAGADGLLIEVHPNPAKAMSDAAQTISPLQFEQTLATCRAVANALGRKMSTL